MHKLVVSIVDFGRKGRKPLMHLQLIGQRRTIGGALQSTWSAGCCVMLECESFGTLIVPEWQSAPFWPLLCPDGQAFVQSAIILPNHGELIVPGQSGQVLPVDYCNVLALRISFIETEMFQGSICS